MKKAESIWGRMDQKIKKLWVKTLRSGRFKKGKDELYKDGRYCVIGVLGKILEEKKITPGALDRISVNVGSDVDLNPITAEALFNLNDVGAWRGQAPFDGFVELGNGKPWGFRRFASWIEKNL